VTAARDAAETPEGRRATLTPHAGEPCASCRAHKVILVDTDVGFRKELAGALGRFGIELVWRARVLGLSGAVDEHDPIAVILSADLPGGDPVELLRQLRARPDQARQAVFLVGDRIPRALTLTAYARGADAVLERGGAAPELAARLLGRAGLRSRERRGTAKSVADAAIALCATAREPGEATQPSTNGSTSEASGIGLTAGAGFNGLGPEYRGSPPSGAGAPAPAGAPGAPGTVPDVVVVEADPALLDMLRSQLVNRGYATLGFSDGREALQVLRALDTAGRRPVVLFDVDAPGLDGQRILRELGDARPGEYRVILCTAHPGRALGAPGVRPGALDHLTRPLRLPIVLAKLERLLGGGSLTAAAGG